MIRVLFSGSRMHIEHTGTIVCGGKGHVDGEVVHEFKNNAEFKKWVGWRGPKLRATRGGLCIGCRKGLRRQPGMNEGPDA